MGSDDELIDSVYLGDDWLLYASTDISFEWSEAVAPCLILGCDAVDLSFKWGDERASIKGAAFLHAAGVCSETSDKLAAVVVYFDPLSQTGASIQKLAASSVTSLGQEINCVAPAATLRSFCTGDLDCASASSTVARIAATLLPLGQSRRRLDPRLPALRNWFFNVFEGRINVGELAEIAGVSGDHLREIFRSQVGMTMSGYSSWVRLYQTACAITQNANELTRVNSSRLFTDVGFYDSSHASKVVRRYLDLKPTEMLEPKKFVDCRSRS